MEDQLAQLRQQIEVERRQRKDAELRASEAERLANETQRQIEEAKLQREGAERQREEEKRQFQRQIQPTTLPEFLHGCHRYLYMPFTVIRNRNLGTKGDPTRADGKLRPNKLREWTEGPALLEEIWETVFTSDLMTTRTFGSMNYLAESARTIERRAVSSEADLAYMERLTVETPIISIIENLREFKDLRKEFNIRGSINFFNHKNTMSSAAEVEEAKAYSQDRLHTPPSPPPKTIPSEQESEEENKSPKGHQGTAADIFCIYNIDNTGYNIPVLVAEYKAPHKVSLEEIYQGLSEMDLNEVTTAELNDKMTAMEKITTLCTQIIAALVTQAFSYMIGLGVQYGYVCTGQAFIFLFVEDDPRICNYFLSVPSRDVGEVGEWDSSNLDKPNKLHLTAVSQVLAFTLLAMQSHPKDRNWQESARDTLEIWDVSLKNITERLAKLRKECPNVPLVPASKRRLSTEEAYLKKSPVRSRKSVRLQKKRAISPSPRGDIRQFDTDDDSDSPSRSATKKWPGPPDSNLAVVIPHRPRDSSSAGGAQQQENVPGEDSSSKANQQRSRPYCTHACLLGLTRGRPLDRSCPNFRKHGRKHQIDAMTLVQLLREQFTKDLVAGLDDTGIHGARGVVFKVTLLSHGYTMLAKCTTRSLKKYLKHEVSIYDTLRSIQGIHIPVCLGSFDLARRFWFCGLHRMAHMMLLSYAGIALSRLPSDIPGPEFSRFEKIHHILYDMRVKHRDFDPRNMIYDSQTDHVMLIDFERSELISEQEKKEFFQALEQKNIRKRKRIQMAREKLADKNVLLQVADNNHRMKMARVEEGDEIKNAYAEEELENKPHAFI